MSIAAERIVSLFSLFAADLPLRNTPLLSATIFSAPCVVRDEPLPDPDSPVSCHRMWFVGRGSSRAMLVIGAPAVTGTAAPASRSSVPALCEQTGGTAGVSANFSDLHPPQRRVSRRANCRDPPVCRFACRHHTLVRLWRAFALNCDTRRVCTSDSLTRASTAATQWRRQWRRAKAI